MAETAKLIIDGKEYEFPVIEGTEGERAIDISKLRGQTKAITVDEGFVNTGSTTSDITFLAQVDCRPGYSNFVFYLDGKSKASWSGQSDWQEMTYPVSAGVHTFTWYFYNGSHIGGETNAAWIDLVSLPTIAEPIDCSSAIAAIAPRI